MARQARWAVVGLELLLVLSFTQSQQDHQDVCPHHPLQQDAGESHVPFQPKGKQALLSCSLRPFLWVSVRIFCFKDDITSEIEGNTPSPFRCSVLIAITMCPPLKWSLDVASMIHSYTVMLASSKKATEYGSSAIAHIISFKACYVKAVPFFACRDHILIYSTWVAKRYASFQWHPMHGQIWS